MKNFENLMSKAISDIKWRVESLEKSKSTITTVTILEIYFHTFQISILSESFPLYVQYTLINLLLNYKSINMACLCRRSLKVISVVIQ